MKKGHSRQKKINSEKSLSERKKETARQSCLENHMDSGALSAIVYGVAKSQTQMSMHTCTHTHTHTVWRAM